MEWLIIWNTVPFQGIATVICQSSTWIPTSTFDFGYRTERDAVICPRFDTSMPRSPSPLLLPLPLGLYKNFIFNAQP